MIQRIFLPLILAYCIYLISVFFHELNHKKIAKKFNLKILRTRKEVTDSKGFNPSRFSLFIFGIELKPFGGNLHLKDRDTEKLKFNEQIEFFLAGIKSDITISIFLVFIYFCLVAFDFAGVTNIVTAHVSFIFSASLVFVLGKTFDNIFDPFNKGGDIKKLFQLIKKNNRV